MVDRGQAGDAGLDGTGLGEVLFGRATSSTLNGFEGADVLLGGAGNDTLDGGDGDDIVRGLGGNDIIDVGLGQDRIEWVNATDGRDLVTRFDGDPTGGQDVVDLRRLFDALGIPAGSRGARVQLVDNGATVDVYLNLDPTNANFEVHALRLETTDLITLGADLFVGD